MGRNRGARLVLWAMAAYTAALGLLFAAFQPAASALFRSPVRDPQILFGFGIALLTIAALKVVVARDPAAYRPMVAIILASEGAFAAWQLYEWLARGWTAVAATGIVDAAFFVLLLAFLPPAAKPVRAPQPG